MLLDGVLAQPEFAGWRPRAEKVATSRRTPARAGRHSASGDQEIGLVTELRSVSLTNYPLASIRRSSRVPVPRSADSPRRLSRFLRRHARLFQVLPSWTLRLVFPRAIAHAYGVADRDPDEFESPLHPHTVEELMWYFEQRRTMSPTASAARTNGLCERRTLERPRFYRSTGSGSRSAIARLRTSLRWGSARRWRSVPVA